MEVLKMTIQKKPEIFKPLNEDAGYSISNYGRVYSHKRNIMMSLKLTKDGYHEIILYINGKPRYERVHRLVALYFCEKPEGATVVNHKDMNKTNNYYENLEWCTASENTKHWYDNSENSKTIQLNASELGAKATRMVIDVYLHGEFVGRFYGKKETADILGKSEKTIYNCLNEDRATRDGYTFKYIGTEAEVEREGGGTK